ncbi:Membrane-associated guanylate kinase, WW and PDZ domain-containing protein 2 [Liparis tanakae]|uniref:Membrane-associated guanylate kinase, WW and PDZ domain-containing protein 2 n=1 Tax=Liparis tanakae TaxID=230148 RepID=A0A4Z2I0V8_9TELE|nr:Membrane-associated guanylate kinase, WW and PDZ domain-containing protein 2 [Liparis tanakae]
MSKSLKKKNHWTNKVHEAVITRGKEGELGFEPKGGAEIGQFPYFGEVKQGKGLIQSGKLAQDELLLEVNNMPVAGLTTRDVLAVIKHCKDPVRLKCVKQEDAICAVMCQSAREGRAVRGGDSARTHRACLLVNSRHETDYRAQATGISVMMISGYGRKPGSSRRLFITGSLVRCHRLEGVEIPLRSLREQWQHGLMGLQRERELTV